MEQLRAWTDLGVRTGRCWRLVSEAGVDLAAARRWTAAGLDARLAAAAAHLGAPIGQVRALVEDYLAGCPGRDLDDAWFDLAEGGLDSVLPGCGGRPRRAGDLVLGRALRMPPGEREMLRSGRHTMQWRPGPDVVID